MLLYLAQRHQIHLFTFADEVELALLERLRPRLAGMTVVAYDEKRKGSCIDLCQSVGAPPDVVHVQGTSMLPLCPSGAPFVLDLHDIPSRLELQFSRLTRGPLGAVNRFRRSWRALTLRKKELQAVQRASGVIVCSREDSGAITATAVGSSPSPVILRNGINLEEWPQSHEAPERATILFPGALNWEPNVDAAEALARHLLPQVRRSVPAARVLIAGRRPSPEIWREVARDPAVTVVSDPEQMQPLFARATVVAVPLRAATGSRLKILQAMATGRAVVSTPVGAEGLGLDTAKDLWIAPTGRPFVEALVGLLTSERKREELQIAARRTVARYAWQSQLPALDMLYPA